MIDKNLLDILACPSCRSSVLFDKGNIVCSNEKCGKQFNVIQGIPVMLPHHGGLEKDMEITGSAWTNAYRKMPEEQYDAGNVPKGIQVCRSYIARYMRPDSRYFLEAGCGTARTSLDTALHNPGIRTVCLDFSLDALLIAKRLFDQHDVGGYFVCGDMRLLPLRDEIFDFVFADGAIEHFKDTQSAISEFKRVLSRDGRVFVTVPTVSLSMLTVGFIRGNIPNIPLVRSSLEFVHVSLLNGRLMKNGYELSFLRPQLRYQFRHFTSVEIGLFSAYQELRWLRIEMLRRIVRKLIKNELLCPMIYAYATNSIPRPISGVVNVD